MATGASATGRRSARPGSRSLPAGTWQCGGDEGNRLRSQGLGPLLARLEVAVRGLGADRVATVMRSHVEGLAPGEREAFVALFERPAAPRGHGPPGTGVV